jgi:glycosyltransferase involved in cell wall biosynthesis
MVDQKLKVLLIIEQCNPEWASVPLVGYCFFREISKLVEVVLVTHERNRPALERLNATHEIIYISESSLSQKYYRLVEYLAGKSKVIWPLYHALTYPIFAEFNHKVYQTFSAKVLNKEYDLVHALTPMMPRYPFEIIKACQEVPFLLGPVNGGVPFPPGFQETARKEFVSLNFLRAVGRALIPGYKETYRKATRILAGSTYTLNLIKEMFKIPNARISLFYENGISSSFLEEKKQPRLDDEINLLFVGRLVPYKCADLILEAISRLDQTFKQRVRLTIVGDGSEQSNLIQMTQTLKLENLVKFAGWVNHQDVLKYYQEADVFCFPSIREFGGAVVLEAMACGLPCIVANNGGIGEYVTEATGFKIEPLSREYLIEELKNKIEILLKDPELRQNMSAQSIERVREFTWEQKAKKIIEIYEEMLGEKVPVLNSSS